jgi:predicted amidohydrolase YtcJ
VFDTMPSEEQEGFMTTVFRNARVFDGHRYVGDAGDVTVDEGVIVSVGREGPERAKGAEVVDAEGGLLAPGFVDAHVHAVQGGLERIRCDLTGIPADQDAYLRAIGTYAADRPDEDWILGGGWAMAAFPGGTPTAASLDSAVADRPVFLPNRDHHGAWVNTMALRLAGITRDTPDPAHGRVERDASGNPTGTLHEAAMALVARHLPPTTDRELYDGLLAGQEYLLSLGVTSWQDAIVGAYSGMADNGPTYAAAASAGDLRASVVGALWWNRNRGAEQIEDLVRRRAELSHGRFVASAVKIMQDGVAENGTAAMLEPYLDRCGHSTDNAGMSFVSPELLKGYVAELDRLGFQVHFHGLGDRSVREALDALEGTDPAHRHHIAHLQLVHRDDVGRFAVLGVSANIQALWACYDDQMVDLTLPLLSADRAGRQYPFGELSAAGANVVAGSDWPVSTPDPLQAIHVAVNRTAHGLDGRVGTEPFLPEQALSLEAAMIAYTRGSAWINGRDKAGVIAPGNVADLVVLDRDPFDDPTRIGAATVVSTWIDGQAVYRA